jgi:signal transduction histidine kinase
MSIFCFFTWLDNETSIFPPTFENRLDYYNITAVFFVLYLISGLLLLWSRTHKSLQVPTVWLALISSFIFMDCISYLDLVRGNGITGIALGYLTIAVVFSTRLPILAAIFLINAIIFYNWISQIPGLSVGEYKMSLIFNISISIAAFIIFEHQRRKIFESQTALAEKIKELNKALDVKSVFYGHIIHELRTPLNAIIGFSEMVNKDTYKPKTIEKIKEYTGYIHSSGNHLLSIVNELLNSTKIETGEYDVTLEEIVLEKELQSHINELESIYISRQQHVKLHVFQNDIPFTTDRRIFKQIIFNLISNAIKFTPVGGKIDITAEEEQDKQVIIIIKDSGCGMDKKLLSTVNDPNSSSETYFVTSTDGTGFGLIIVRQFVQLLNGTISFQSQPGNGTEVRMTFSI